MEIRFLGTGAADWNGPDERGEYRRLTSTLFDGRLLIDLTRGAMDMLPEDAAIGALLYTHSHADHYDPAALDALKPEYVYAHESWAGAIAHPRVTPLRLFEPVQAAGFTVTALPSNHATERPDEVTVHYLIEKGGKRLLYATDGAWLLKKEVQAVKGALDAIVIDCTIGDGHEGDYRIFEHNSLPMIRMMARTWLDTGFLKRGAPIFLTHMARTLHPDQKTLAASIETPFVACYDGMTAAV